MSPDPRAQRVLIIDADEDEASLVEAYLREGLKEPGLEVRYAGSAASARAELEKAPPDVLLLDLRLRDEDALSFLASLRERGLAIPTVVLTGRANAEAATQALRAGAADVLVKPSLTPASLAATVRYAVQLEEARKRGAETEMALRRLEAALSGVLGGIEAAMERLPGGSPAGPLLAGAREAALRGIELGRELLAFGRGQGSSWP